MRLYLTVIVLTFCCGLSAQQPDESHSLLWEITGKGLKQPSYLFGTMHILCAEDAQLSDSLQFSIEQSGLVYFEVDMDNTAELLGIFKHIRMNNNKKLSDLLTTAEYQRVQRYFMENRSLLPLSMMERFKPYFIAAMLSESKMPCETRNGMEEVIMRFVKKQQKEILGLETIAFQASVFDSIPYEEQAKELLKAIDSAGKQDTMTVKMLEVYRQQDLEAIEKLTQQEDGGVGAYLDLFLFGRNAKWIPVIDSAVQHGTVLVAVGAAHLPGEKGVIALLRRSGYTLRPMRHEVNRKTL